MKDAILVGHSIYLRIPHENDVINGKWHTWYNDYETTKFNNHGIYPIDEKNELEFIKKSNSSSDKIVFAICTKHDDFLIGNCAIQKIDLLYRKAQIAVTIGESEYRSRTCALEAIGLLIEHGFMRLNLNRIYGKAHRDLHRWVSMLEVLGFEKEGILREDMLRNNEYIDSIYFSILSKHFFSLFNKRKNKILFDNISLLLQEIAQIKSE